MPVGRLTQRGALEQPAEVSVGGRKRDLSGGVQEGTNVPGSIFSHLPPVAAVPVQVFSLALLVQVPVA